MALYVAVCLLAALIALGEDADHGHVRAFGLVWGTTLGLALAHAFAFRVSARLASGGQFGRSDAQIVLAQLAGVDASDWFTVVTSGVMYSDTGPVPCPSSP